MSTSEPLVSISKKISASASLGEKAKQGPIADKFFVVGSLAGFLGTVLVGSILWLVKNAWMNTPANYMSLRELHAHIQLFCLFGLPIAGFLLQATPRMLGGELGISPITVYCTISLPILGTVFEYFGANQQLVSCLYAAGFVVPFWKVGRMIRSRVTPPPFAPFLLTSLACLMLSPFFPVTTPSWGFAAFWGSTGAALLGASHIFIPNILGGKRLSAASSRFVFVLFAVSVGCIAAFSKTGDERFWITGAVLVFGSLLIFLVKIGFFEAWPRAFDSFFTFSFFTGYLWALVGGAVAIVSGPAGADGAMHILATGWALPILVAASLHITAFLSGEKSTSRFMLGAALLWQIVPITRGLGPILGFGAGLAWIIPLVSLAFIGGWVVKLIHRERKLLARQLGLRKGEQMIVEA